MKPKINVNGSIIEFDSETELIQFINSTSPNPDLSSLIKSFEHEILGRQVIKDLYVALKNQNLTQAQEADIIARVNGTFIALLCGFIRGARDIAGGLVVAGSAILKL